MKHRAYPGVLPQAIAQLLSVPLRTVRRWRTIGHMPDAYGKLWQQQIDPDLGHLDPVWRGWKVRDGLLYLPEGSCVTPGDVRALPLLLDIQRQARRREHQPVQFLLDV